MVGTKRKQHYILVMLLHFLNKPVFTHQPVTPVVSLTNTDALTAKRTARNTQLKLFNTLSQSHRKYDVILYITLRVQCQYHAGRSANCPQSEELFLTMMQTPSKKSETNSPHLLCLL